MDNAPNHIIIVIASASASISLIIVLSFLQIRKKWREELTKRTKRTKPSRTLAVLGSGGHTSEMLRLLSSLNQQNFEPLYYVVASTDTTSINRFEKFCEQDDTGSQFDKPRLKPPRDDHIYNIPRAREVGQSYITSVFTTILSILSSAHIILKVKPDILIINGPGTCIPIALWTYIGRSLGICEGKIVFCESFCRVNSISLTGKLLIKLNVVDLFLIHWQELMDNIHQNYATRVHSRKIKFMLIDSFIKHVH
jgi:beta-1,4-N-acetylglucosaminyltransferase